MIFATDKRARPFYPGAFVYPGIPEFGKAENYGSMRVARPDQAAYGVAIVGSPLAPTQRNTFVFRGCAASCYTKVCRSHRSPSSSSGFTSNS